MKPFSPSVKSCSSVMIRFCAHSECELLTRLLCMPYKLALTEIVKCDYSPAKTAEQFFPLHNVYWILTIMQRGSIKLLMAPYTEIPI